jgi:hypothetical protein
MASKRILKVESINGDYGSRWAHSGLTFAYCSKIVNNKVKPLSNFCSCREELAGCLFYDDRNKIPIDRSRYVVRHITASSNAVASEKWFDKTTEAGLRIVNIMEARHEWPLTKMLDVEPDVNDITNYDTSVRQLTILRKVLIGSNKWMRSPHMISLYILLFRLGTHSKFSSIKSYKKLSEVCNTCSSKQFGDMGHVFRTFKFWDILMANFDKMFTGMPTRHNFNSAKYAHGHYDEGITKLCKFKCSNEKINSRFVALAKKPVCRK